MPILDPIIQFNLLNCLNKNAPADNSTDAFKKFLHVASIWQNKNLYATLAAIQFKKDLATYISFVNEYFQINYKIDENKSNCFKDLYDQIKMKNQRKPRENGKYLKFQSFNTIYQYFQLFFDYPENHSWFLTDNPIAVLCLKTHDINEKCLKLIILEIDIMSACGFTLVLCIDAYTEKKQLPIELFKEIIFKHKFSEIHINYNSQYCKEDFLNITKSLIEKGLELESYCYIYCRYINIFNSNIENPLIKSTDYEMLHEYLKLLKKRPRMKIIYFSEEIDKSLKDLKIDQSNFKYCENGFENDEIKVYLNDIPLYDKNTDKFTFNDTLSENNYGYIKPDDFLFMEDLRVEIKIKDLPKKDNIKYVDFDDIHYINPSFYVKDQLNLVNVKLDDIKLIKEIISKANEKFISNQYKEFKREKQHSIFIDENMKKKLLYVLYSYKKYDNNFCFNLSQVYVAYEAIMFCAQHQNTNSRHGIIYQVETGEGKSSIAIIIAAALALYKKTVHIVTSNTYLVNRDYDKSVDFFKQLQLKSAPLLHKNEIPEFGFQRAEFKKENYDSIFFEEQFFENSLKMNIDVCISEKKEYKANIVFSTLINFESLYLYMMEKCPGKIKDYYKNCSLVIDEADLILIDELTNGTILSKTMKSNGEEVLSFVYDSYMKKSVNENDNSLCKKILPIISRRWPDCTDIKPKHILRMFEEIRLVNEDSEFVEGLKYSIEPIKDSLDENLINKREIVPFNYDHTGLIERNKEFSGFIQQFIALKEKYNKPENDDIVVKSPSLNYLYISHPIYAGLYSSICGLTGTIGKKADKKILNDHYKLHTQKIPREKVRRFYEFPIILCQTKEDKFDRIVDEIMNFHLSKKPVLAIFNNFTDIELIEEKLNSKQGFKSEHLNKYNGRDENIKPKENAGKKYAVTLGTNVCGRGTHIDTDKKYPLHVIVTFYTTNSRIMNQAFGRTARGENFGTARIICLSSEYLKEIETYNENDLDTSLNMLMYVNDAQTKFIQYYREKGDWIFNSDIGKQNLNLMQLKALKEVKINVNRIKACNYKYPICMEVSTFLNIQAQKIFSLFNCPNCQYTWKLFQQYVREMILESWSIFMDNEERKFFSIDQNDDSFYEYKNKFDEEKDKLIKQLNEYFPSDSNKWEIIPTFMHIYNKIANEYSYIYILLNGAVNSYLEEKKTIKTTILTFINFEFKPFTLIDQSGARIANIGNNDQERSFIEDPELKYIKRGSKFLSITERIDSIFESICRFLDNFIGTNLGLKLFLRRTLGGCEFGLCYDFDLMFDGDLEFMNNITNCLIDRDPILVFSVNVRSLIPFLASILILLFIFLIIITGKIGIIISEITGINIKAKGVSFAKTMAKKVLQKVVEKAVNKACDYLTKVLFENMESFRYSHPKIYKTFLFISDLILAKTFDGASQKVFMLFQNTLKFKKNSFFANLFIDLSKIHMLKLSFLTILCGASFLFKFFIQKSIKYSRTKVASEFDHQPNESNLENIIAERQNLLDSEIPDID